MRNFAIGLFICLASLHASASENPQLDLTKFREHSLEKLKPILDEQATEEGVWFQDHVGPVMKDFSLPAACIGPSSDYASVSLILNIKPFANFPNIKLAHTFWLNGTEESLLVYDYRGKLSFNSTESFILKIKESVFQSQRTKLFAQAKAKWANLEITELGFGMWNARAKFTTSKFREAFNFFTDSNLVEFVELDSLAYLAPYEIDLAKKIGTGTEKPTIVVEPETFRTVSKKYRDANYLQSAPSLPPPFGTGWIDRQVGECKE